jgi:hypothetical protein
LFQVQFDITKSHFLKVIVALDAQLSKIKASSRPYYFIGSECLKLRTRAIRYIYLRGAHNSAAVFSTIYSESPAEWQICHW